MLLKLLTRPIFILAILLLLTGCNAHVAGVAGYLLAEPVAKLAVHGGKSVYEAASTVWQKVSTEEPSKN